MGEETKGSGEDTFIGAVRRLVRFYDPELRDILIIVLYALMAGALFLAVPLAANSLVTTIAFGQLIQPLVVLAMIVFVGLVCGGGLKILQVRLAELVQQRIFVRAASQLVERLPSLHFDFIRRNHAPDLVNRFLEVVTIQKVTAQMLMEGLGVFFQVLTGLILISFYHPFLLAYGIVLAGAILLIFVLGIGATPTAIDESSKKYYVLEWLEDLARYPILFKSTWGKLFGYRRADERMLAYLESRREHFSILQRQFVAAYVVHAVGASLLLILGGWLVMIDQLTLGQLVAAEIAVSGAVYAVSRLGKTFESFYDLLAAVTKLDAIMTTPTESHAGTVKLPESGALQVEFENVSLRSDNPRAAPIAISLPAGSKICVFGRTASGKSTLANYLLTLQTPGVGRVKIHGVDVRDIEVNSLRSRVHLVRGREILADTIENNISCLRPEVGTEQVLDALEKVRLLEHVQKLPEGIRTQLSSVGNPLSSGQVAQLMLARAIAGNPGVLVLDETLDVIDSTLLKGIYSVLLDPAAPWTLIDLTSDPVVWGDFAQHYRLSTHGLERIESGASTERLKVPADGGGDS